MGLLEISTESRNHLRFLKRKPNRKRNILSISDCLTRVVVHSIPINKSREQIQKERAAQKIKNRDANKIQYLKFLDNLFVSGKKFKNKQVRRYKNLLIEFGRPIPPEIDDRVSLLQRKSSKNQKQNKRKRKPKKYNSYINSGIWEKRKNLYYQSHLKLCEICNSSSYVHLHHKYYGDYGLEKDEHLVPLCKQHHEEFHLQLGKTKKDMVWETDSFIKRKISECNK